MISTNSYNHRLNRNIVESHQFGGFSALERYAMDRFERRQIQRGSLGKFSAIYLFTGGDAARHKYNYLNPIDDNSGFRLTFAGTVTHSANGIQGSSAYANTHYQPDNNTASRRFGVYFYSRTNSAINAKDWGHRSPSILNYVEARLAAGNFRATQYSSTANTVANSDSSGFFGWQRIDDNNCTRLIRNGTVVTVSLATGGVIFEPIYLMAMNNEGTAQEFSSRQYSFFAITQGGLFLSEDEQYGLREDVTDFQTLLARNI